MNNKLPEKFTCAACSENGYKRWGLPIGNRIALTLLAEAKQSGLTDEKRRRQPCKPLTLTTAHKRRLSAVGQSSQQTIYYTKCNMYI